MTNQVGSEISSERISEFIQKIRSLLPHEWVGVRKDLKLHKGAPDETNSPTWVIEDPVKGTFFQLGSQEVELFICLSMSDLLNESLASYSQRVANTPDETDIASFLVTLQKAGLTLGETEKPIVAGASWTRLLGSYLFFRIPLLRPDRLLCNLESYVKFLWSPFFVGIYVLLSLTGIVLVSQQIDLYLGTVNYLLTPSGVLLFLVSLTIVKIAHELAHGLACTHHGVYVRRMGIALMVFVPMLYTDTTDAWKLPSRRGRLFIDGAGILTELVIAGVALFCWALVADGPARSLLFLLSSASLVSTLLGNINPMMRFDGYYLLMDWWRISNLHSRAAAMLKYKIRRIVLNWQAMAPEESHLHTRLWLFGLFCAVYRFFIYFSIALIVYHFMFKALGVILFVFQLFLMIVLPLIRELRFWVTGRHYWGGRVRPWVSACVAILLLFWINIPIERKIDLPALILLQDVVDVAFSNQGRLMSSLPDQGTRVHSNQLLVEIHNDALNQEKLQLKWQNRQLEIAIANTPSGGETGGYRKWLQAEKARITAAIRALDEAIDQLKIYARIDGTIVKRSEQMQLLSIVAPQTPILTLADTSAWEVRAYVPESETEKLSVTDLGEAKVRFFDLETQPRVIIPRSQSLFPVGDYPNYTLFDIAGGPIATQTINVNDTPKPLQAHYSLVFDVPNGASLNKAHGTPCTVEISGERESITGRFLNWFLPILSAEGLL